MFLQMIVMLLPSAGTIDHYPCQTDLSMKTIVVVSLYAAVLNAVSCVCARVFYETLKKML